MGVSEIMPSLFISKGACSHSCGWVFTFRLSRKGERQGESGGGGKRRKQDGREGGHPSEMECMQRIFKGGQVEGGQFSCKYKSVCRLSHL